ncbi:MAG: PEP/pyruvate-binding domain-containing protein [Bacteriovoracia bacterium]
MSKSKAIPGLIITAVAFFVSGVAAAGPAEQEWNKRMIRAYEAAKTSGQPSSDLQRGYAEFQAKGFPAYTLLTQMAAHPEPREMILQEYLRMQEEWGMPWLPIKFTYSNAESDFITLAQTLNQTISTKNGQPLADDALLTGYLLGGSIYHNHDNRMINTMRANAVVIQGAPGFMDIRLEIHQQPSLLTIERVKKFIAQRKAQGLNDSVTQMAATIQNQLESLFGGGDVATFYIHYNVTGAARSALDNYQTHAKFLMDKPSAKALTGKLDAIRDNLTALADASVKAGNAARAATTNCRIDRDIDCAIEQIDLLHQLQTATFSLGGALIGRLQDTRTVLSLADIQAMVDALTKSAESIGLIRRDTLKNTSLGGGGQLVDPAEVLMLIEKVEGSVQEGVRNFRAMFNPVLAKYKEYVPQADKFIDDSLRSTVLLQLTNFLAQIHTLVQTYSGRKITIGTEEISAPHRMLNPGIARGILKVTAEAEANDENYNWRPDYIYVLTKTPPSLSKVAGVLTTDSGSTISHVQLLASNHGLPNAVIPQSLVDKLRGLENQDVLYISLPNGEVSIKRFDQATPAEIDTWKVYNKVREQKRTRIQIPADMMKYNRPLFLEQLRMTDSGIVAGGKACGQGELASVFPDHVPQAFVLPFGVYYAHMKETGILEDARKIFEEFDLSDTSDEGMAKKVAALEKIRQRIRTIELKPELIAFIAQTLSKEPFLGRGVFVRSDTNAEDLPQFVGAGLNETIPNVVGLAKVVQAIKDVWASPFTRKAMTWRQDLIENPWDVYPSVVVQIGINGTKAGVMVVGSTQNEEYQDEVMIAANEGVGITVVNGEYNPEEVLVSRHAGTVNRVRRAYAPTRKVLLPDGGFADVPVQGLDPIIPEAHAKALAGKGDGIQKHLMQAYPKLESRKWDMEWAMVEDKVVLLQIRPFIGNKIAANVAELKRLEKPDALQPKDVKFPLAGRQFTLPEPEKEK